MLSDDREGRTDPGRGPATAPILEARIRPHRSLTTGNFRLLMVIFALIGTVSSLPFVILGAWPVAGFMGLDIALVYLAFRANFRAARAFEHIVLTPLELLYAKVSAKGRRAEWRFNPVWVRVERDDHVEFGLQRLRLSSRGDTVEVASFLGPDAKEEFASRLTRALNEAKRGPRFS